MLPPNWRRLPLATVASLAPVQKLEWGLARASGIEVAVKREDLLHPQLGGNKFYKLAGHLDAAEESGAARLLSFGGAFSNHLYALAAAGAALGVPTVGIVRGERPSVLSPTLQDAQNMGMELRFVSRADYRQKTDPVWLARLQQDFPGTYIVPEGGGGLAGAAGCRAWGAAAVALSPWTPDWICLAAGTGSSTAGVLASETGVPVCAVLTLKGVAAEVAAMKAGIIAQAERLTGQDCACLPSLLLESNYHCGGYARFPSGLRQFAMEFEAETGVPLDPVYTAKVFWAIAQKAQAGHWQPGTRILVLHSGGLQGRRGFSGL